MALTLAIAGASFGQLAPLTPGSATISVDGGAQFEVPLTRTQLANGNGKYAGSASFDGLDFTIVYVVDEWSDPMSSVSGQFKCVNSSGATRAIDSGVTFDLCPALAGGTQLGGNFTLLLATNSDGGNVSCISGVPSLCEVSVGDISAHKMFWCPFSMSSSGSGTMQTGGSFGTPVPSLAGPSSAPTIGSRNHFKLSAGDALTITSNVFVKSLGSSTPCAGDLNSDGSIDGQDLVTMVSRWGASDSPCVVADLNEDGIVDGNDLAVLLSQWGNCAE